MKKLKYTIINLLAFTALMGASFGAIVINELDSDTPGTDTLEFIELYSDTGGMESLTGLTIVLYNGSTDTSYNAIDLDGFSTDSNGYFILGGDALLAALGLTAGVDSISLGTTNTIQNGADAVALYMDDATNFPNGTAATATNLVDAIVYDTNEADDAGLLAVFGGTQINEDENADKDNQSIQRFPDGTGNFEVADATGNAENIPEPSTAILSIFGLLAFMLKRKR